ncbi:hypothetical protein HOD38_02630 [archaeon]|jgi:hypothetical protein|nr:hypothetical protein [archaeon]MBT4397139.1 hypothetical protein [archaeon]MBT4441555.1 hypothetical protein [archaeon]
MVSLNFTDALAVIKPLFFFIIGMVIYTVFVFKFYKFIARKDIFELNLNQYNSAEQGLFKQAISVFFYIIEYILIFPIFVFFWFGILTILLAFLAEGQPLTAILLVSMALIGTVRVAAYYSEDLSRDVAKMLPFALLGVFLINITNFSYIAAFELLSDLPSHWEIIPYYLIFIILLEFILRIITLLAGWIIPNEEPEPEEM